MRTGDAVPGYRTRPNVLHLPVLIGAAGAAEPIVSRDAVFGTEAVRRLIEKTKTVKTLFTDRAFENNSLKNAR